MRPEELARKCSTVDEARNLIRNARTRGNDEVAVAAERRLFELQGQAHDDPNDSLVRAVWEGVYAYENIVLSRKHGRNVLASRTRQFVREHGAYNALLLWARRKQSSDGFKALIKAGHPEITAEYFVAVTFADRFPDDARKNAEKRLGETGLTLPSGVRST
jgi:predicted AAA+ superfamily ATPase